MRVDPDEIKSSENRDLKSRILIVDDNPTNIQLLEMMLDMAGYKNVLSVSDSREVEALHRKWHFDLILLDIQMPHMDGFEVMDKLSGIMPNDYLPVLVLTAQKDMETRLRALELGAKDFLTKPFDRVETLNRIKNMLEVRGLYNERRWQTEILEAKVRERTQEIEEHNVELEESRLELIRRLGRAGEYRDNETGMHVIRMSNGCQRLALAIGLTDDHAKKILHASPMHDIGKIGIPDKILLKPGKLDPDEWTIMKTHVEIGADILGGHDSEMMQIATTIALTHHEMWDGAGYPHGKKGEDIPLEGRISTVCDVFDALTSERPYKKAWEINDAVAYINEKSGQQFDPNLVDHFNKILPEILNIRETFSDEEEGK